MTDPKACPEDCLRRSWLLGLCAPYIERALLSVSGSEWFALLGLGNEDLAAAASPKHAQSILAQVEAMSAEHFADELSAAQCWAVCGHDDRYPGTLRKIDAAPWALIARGDPTLLTDISWKESVSIVGSRRASFYGREVARSLGHDLAAAGMVVISGLAFGIDACAHRGALDQGRTVAVVACGPDIAYPASHRSLWRRITEAGLVISELPPGASWSRQRNAPAPLSLQTSGCLRPGVGCGARTRHFTELGRSQRPAGRRCAAGPRGKGCNQRHLGWRALGERGKAHGRLSGS